jgi:hypothetical protein
MALLNSRVQARSKFRKSSFSSSGVLGTRFFGMSWTVADCSAVTQPRKSNGPLDFAGTDRRRIPVMPKKPSHPRSKNRHGSKPSPHIPRLLSWPAIAALFCQVRTDACRILVLYPRPRDDHERVERMRELAAILGARLQRLALVNVTHPPSPKEPGVPPMWSMENFNFRVRKLTWEFGDLLNDTDKMNPAARLKFLRRRLGNLGRKFQLYSKAQVIDRAALVREIAEAEAAEQKLATANGSGLVAAESANGVDMPTPKVVSISESGRKLVAVDKRTHRIIGNIGPDRVAFDFTVTATRLAPKTGDQPAPVLSMKKESKKTDELA